MARNGKVGQTVGRGASSGEKNQANVWGPPKNLEKGPPVATHIGKICYDSYKSP